MRVAILPIGSTEYHGGHLPLETDWIIPQYFAEKISGRLKNKFDIKVLQPIKISPVTSTRDSPGSVDISADGFMRSVLDVLKEVSCDFIVLLLGHGGRKVNACAVLLTEMVYEQLGMDCCALDYFKAIPKEILQQKHEFLHASEVETSLMLLIAPEKVKPDWKSRPPSYPYESFRMKYPQYNRHILSVFRKGMHRTLSYNGEPALASAEKGQKIAEIVINELSESIEKLVLHEKP